MANNYIQFSVFVPLTQETLEWAADYLESDECLEEMEECDNSVDFDYDFNFNGIFIYAMEGFCETVDNAAVTIRKLLQHDNSNEVTCLSWCESCTHPDPGKFGGGTILISGEEIRYQPEMDWVRQNAKEMKAAL